MPAKKAAALIALLIIGVVVRTAVAARGWFYYDDLTLYAQASSHRLPDLDLLFSPHDGHLMPGSWLIEWTLAHGSGLWWPAAVMALGVGNLLAASAVAWAYRPLSHSLVPLAAYLFTPVTLSTTTWLAAAVNTLPLHTALALCLGCALRAMRAPSPATATRWHLGAAAALLFGLLFSERALFIAPTVLLMLVCCRLLGPAQWRRGALLTFCMSAPTAAWAGVYTAMVGDPRTAPANPGPFLSHGYGLGLVPTLAGGPWHWERWHPGPPWAAPDTAGILLGAAAGLLLLSLTIRRAAAWLPVASYPVLCFLALALARSGPDTALEIAQTLRHVSEVAVLGAMALASTLPPRLPVSARVFGSAWIVSSLISTLAFAQAWAAQPSRDFFHGLRASLSRHEAPLLDQDLPLEVLLPVTHPYNRLSAYGSALGDSSPVSAATTAPVIIGADGSLRPAQLHEMRATASPHQCDAETTLPLDGPLMEREWVVRLNYFADQPGFGTLSLDGEWVDFPVDAGIHSIYVQVTGGGQVLHVSVPTACFSRSSVGILQP